MRAEAMLLAHNPEWCARNVRRLWRVIKAMRAYRKAHPLCEITGRKGVHVHHIQPVHVRPDLADSPENMITLCPKAHEIVGHGGNWKHWNPNVVLDSSNLRIGISTRAKGVTPAGSERCPFCQSNDIHHEPDKHPANVTPDATEHCHRCGLWSAPNAPVVGRERSERTHQQEVRQ